MAATRGNKILELALQKFASQTKRQDSAIEKACTWLMSIDEPHSGVSNFASDSDGTEFVPDNDTDTGCNPDLPPFQDCAQNSSDYQILPVHSHLPSTSTDQPMISTDLNTFSTSVSQNTKKPNRPCLFCGKMQAQLARHLKRVHNNVTEVQQAVKQPRTERLRAFDVMKKKGIFAHNIALKKSDDDVPLERERKQGSDDLALCNGCKGFYSQHRICQHRKSCPESQGYLTKSGSLNVRFLGEKGVNDDNFHKEIIQRFRNDETGLLCQTDPTIVKMGRKFWAKSTRKDRRVIMNDMRTLGNLVMECRKVAHDNTIMAKDIVDRKNFEQITEAIQALTFENGKLKAGLKLAIGFLLKKLVRVLKGVYIQENNMHSASEVDHFAALLDLNWDFMFYKEQLVCERRRQNLRKPVDMPLEKDLTTFRNFLLEETTRMTNDSYKKWDRHDFVYLRNLLVSRLTLFNARRGGEPARMLLSEWEEAQDGSWIDRQQVERIQDPLEELVSELKLAYQSGKGSRRLVPVLFPKDTLPAMEKLMSERTECGVSDDNPFLFPNTGMSDDHVIGWNSIQSIAKVMGDKLERPQLLIADKFRHRTSTMFALLEIPCERREMFYKHMGHSEQMNRDVYQCPLAIREITEVGSFLQNLDHKTSQQTVHIPSTSSQNIEGVCSSDNTSEQIWPLIVENIERDTENTSHQVVERNEVERPGSAFGFKRYRRYFKWSEEQNRVVSNYFETVITDTKTDGTKGALPSKNEILAFLKESKLFHESDMPEAQQISLVKTKLFNERTKKRVSSNKLFVSL